MAILSGGGLFLDRRTKVAGPDPRMQGYLALGWHGAHDGGIGGHRDKGVMLHLVEDCDTGQFDMYFCSTNCLRAFLNACVDKLEIEIDRAKPVV